MRPTEEDPVPPETLGITRALLIYRDPGRLPPNLGPAQLASRPGVVVELSTRGQLRGRTLFGRPTIHADLRGRSPEPVMSTVQRYVDQVIGLVLFVCHADDLATFAPLLGDVHAVVRLPDARGPILASVADQTIDDPIDPEVFRQRHRAPATHQTPAALPMAPGIDVSPPDRAPLWLTA